MATSSTELKVCATLSEMIYARASSDQAITEEDLHSAFDTTYSAFRDAILPANADPSLHISSNGYYYSDNGFTGAIFKNAQGQYIVVLRGSDVGSFGGLTEILNGMATGDSSGGKVDGNDS